MDLRRVRTSVCFSRHLNVSRYIFCCIFEDTMSTSTMTLTSVLLAGFMPRRHVRAVHEDIRPFPCPYCDSFFKKRGTFSLQKFFRRPVKTVGLLPSALSEKLTTKPPGIVFHFRPFSVVLWLHGLNRSPPQASRSASRYSKTTKEAELSQWQAQSLAMLRLCTELQWNPLLQSASSWRCGPAGHKGALQTTRELKVVVIEDVFHVFPQSLEADHCMRLIIYLCFSESQRVENCDVCAFMRLEVRER